MNNVTDQIYVIEKDGGEIIGYCTINKDDILKQFDDDVNLRPLNPVVFTKFIDENPPRISNYVLFYRDEEYNEKNIKDTGVEINCLKLKN